jgi:diaminopimelate epimerase
VIGAELHGESVTLQMSDPHDVRLNLSLPDVPRYASTNFINSGVPHVVIPVERIEEVDVRGDGAAIRHHKMFAPKGANVNFLEKRGPKSVAIRTYERGVEDETLACGTGVVASALIFAAKEQTEGPITVTVRGGCDLTVGFEKNGDNFSGVTLSGPAEFVFEGTIDL